jgi:hypothetical protein
MEKEKLQEQILLSKSSREIAKHFDVSQSTIRYWTKKYQLSMLFNSEYNGLKCRVCNSSLVNMQKVYCSNNCKVKGHYINSKNNTNSVYSQESRGIERKKHFMNILGGKCNSCGYNKNITALEFHHVDPTTKKLQLNMRTFSNNSMNVLIEEVYKCELLCANCHREHHNPRFNYFIQSALTD